MKISLLSISIATTPVSTECIHVHNPVFGVVGEGTERGGGWFRRRRRGHDGSPIEDQDAMQQVMNSHSLSEIDEFHSNDIIAAPVLNVRNEDMTLTPKGIIENKKDSVPCENETDEGETDILC